MMRTHSRARRVRLTPQAASHRSATTRRPYMRRRRRHGAAADNLSGASASATSVARDSAGVPCLRLVECSRPPKFSKRRQAAPNTQRFADTFGAANPRTACGTNPTFTATATPATAGMASCTLRTTGTAASSAAVSLFASATQPSLATATAVAHPAAAPLPPALVCCICDCHISTNAFPVPVPYLSTLSVTPRLCNTHYNFVRRHFGLDTVKRHKKCVHTPHTRCKTVLDKLAARGVKLFSFAAVPAHATFPASATLSSANGAAPPSSGAPPATIAPAGAAAPAAAATAKPPVVAPRHSGCSTAAALAAAGGRAAAKPRVVTRGVSSHSGRSTAGSRPRRATAAAAAASRAAAAATAATSSPPRPSLRRGSRIAATGVKRSRRGSVVEADDTRPSPSMPSLASCASLVSLNGDSDDDDALPPPSFTAAPPTAATMTPDEVEGALAELDLDLSDLDCFEMDEHAGVSFSSGGPVAAPPPPSLRRPVTAAAAPAPAPALAAARPGPAVMPPSSMYDGSAHREWVSCVEHRHNSYASEADMPIDFDFDCMSDTGEAEPAAATGTTSASPVPAPVPVPVPASEPAAVQQKRKQASPGTTKGSEDATEALLRQFKSAWFRADVEDVAEVTEFMARPLPLHTGAPDRAERAQALRRVAAALPAFFCDDITARKLCEVDAAWDTAPRAAAAAATTFVGRTPSLAPHVVQCALVDTGLAHDCLPGVCSRDDAVHGVDCPPHPSSPLSASPSSSLSPLSTSPSSSSSPLWNPHDAGDGGRASVRASTHGRQRLKLVLDMSPAMPGTPRHAVNLRTCVVVSSGEQAKALRHSREAGDATPLRSGSVQRTSLSKGFATEVLNLRLPAVPRGDSSCHWVRLTTAPFRAVQLLTPKAQSEALRRRANRAPSPPPAPDATLYATVLVAPADALPCDPANPAAPLAASLHNLLADPRVHVFTERITVG